MLQDLDWQVSKGIQYFVPSTNLIIIAEMRIFLHACEEMGMSRTQKPPRDADVGYSYSLLALLSCCLRN